MSVSDIGWWVTVGLFALMILCTLAWHLNELFVRPHWVPSDKIDQLVLEMKRRNPNDPIEAAVIEEEAAWYRSDTYEQGIWRRVRKRLVHQV